MADGSASIFTKKARDKLRSPDDLDRYLRVNNPSIWIVLGACLSLVAGLLIWGFFGSVVSTISTFAVVDEDNYGYCFVSVADVARVTPDDQVTVGGTPMRIKEVSRVPFSKDEVTSMLESEYLAGSLLSEQWGYMVVFEPTGSIDLEKGVPIQATITVERLRPISLIFDHSG